MPRLVSLGARCAGPILVASASVVEVDILPYYLNRPGELRVVESLRFSFTLEESRNTPGSRSSGWKAFERLRSVSGEGSIQL